jgi:sugar-specific transcriptional regulator TrmB
MPLREEAVKTLTDAGLTLSQARVYFALIQVGKTEIKDLSIASEMDRSNVYKTIESLQNLGLVEQMVGTPNSYIALPIEYAISILLKRKEQEYALTKRNANDFLKKFSIRQKKILEEEYFTILPGKEAFIKKWEKTLQQVEKNVDLIATEKREPRDDPIWEIYRDLLSKGIKVRWLLDRSKHDEKEFALRVRQFEDLLWYPTLTLRTSFESLKPYGIMCDDKFAVFFLDPTPCVKYSRTLWTNNSTMVGAFQKHFEVIWKQAQDYKPNEENRTKKCNKRNIAYSKKIIETKPL